ncbi:MAG: hypothetical protein ABWX67_01680 [Allosphingosinicella sp.]
MDEKPIVNPNDSSEWARLQAKLRRGIESLDRGEGIPVEQAFDQLDDYIEALANRGARKDAA